MRATSCFLTLIAPIGLAALTACDMPPPTPIPDYTIHVVHEHTGYTALPPNCAPWSGDQSDVFDNQPLPQFGCATARNLAMTVENPEDLLHGRSLDETRGVGMVGAIRRYDNNQTRGLLWTGTDPNQVSNTTASNASSAMSGDVTGGASSSAAPAAAPSAP